MKQELILGFLLCLGGAVVMGVVVALFDYQIGIFGRYNRIAKG